MTNIADAPPPYAASGIVLAGGRSSRMGMDKARLVLRGEPLVARVARLVGTVTNEVIISGPAHLASLAHEARVIPDSAPGLGPLGGLATAFGRATHDLVFIAACDMPFLVPGLMREMLSQLAAHAELDAVIVSQHHGREHLHAALRRQTVLPRIEEQLSTGTLAIHQLMARLRTLTIPAEIVTILDPDGRSTFNVNTRDDWQLARALAGEREEYA